MRQVADLIGTAFAGDLDADGRSMVQEMRVAAWLSPLFGNLASLAYFEDFVHGFVWLEGRKVVGNVTFQRADYGGMRWRISNVVVAPEYRNQGIARALMQETVREIAERGGAWAILQVRADNKPACHLYTSLGFTPVCQEGVWRLAMLPARLPQPDLAVDLCPLADRDWRPRLELVRAARSDLADWLEPLDEAAHRVGLTRWLGEALGRLTGLYRVTRWGAWDRDRLVGMVETIGGWWCDYHRIRLAVHPEARGRLEASLVARGFRSLADDPLQPIVAYQDGDHVEGVAALEAVGFRPQRVLMTMRRQIMPRDAEI
jgi:ribosomal protein S18 acetylase RimI-like enzyme